MLRTFGEKLLLKLTCFLPNEVKIGDKALIRVGRVAIRVPTVPKIATQSTIELGC